MLRMPAEAYTKVVPRVHYQKHALRADTLHCVGEALVQVRQPVVLFFKLGLHRLMSIYRTYKREKELGLHTNIF